MKVQKSDEYMKVALNSDKLNYPFLILEFMEVDNLIDSASKNKQNNCNNNSFKKEGDNINVSMIVNLVYFNTLINNLQ